MWPRRCATPSAPTRLCGSSSPTAITTWRRLTLPANIPSTTWLWTPALRSNIVMGYYEAGHMMYVHLPSLEKLKGDLVEVPAPERLSLDSGRPPFSSSSPRPGKLVMRNIAKPAKVLAYHPSRDVDIQVLIQVHLPGEGAIGHLRVQAECEGVRTGRDAQVVDILEGRDWAAHAAAIPEREDRVVLVVVDSHLEAIPCRFAGLDERLGGQRDDRGDQELSGWRGWRRRGRRGRRRRSLDHFRQGGGGLRLSRYGCLGRRDGRGGESGSGGGRGFACRAGLSRPANRRPGRPRTRRR